MASFENKQGITEIKMFDRVHSFCPMGNAWYDADITVKIEPTDTIMDYLDVDMFFSTINDGELIIEDVVDQVFNYFNTYKPASLSVTAEVRNASHLPVIVTKSM